MTDSDKSEWTKLRDEAAEKYFDEVYRCDETYEGWECEEFKAGADFGYEHGQQYQHEKIVELTIQNKGHAQAYLQQCERNTKLDAKVAKLREALEFYAEKYEWREHWFKVPGVTYNCDPNKPPEEFCGWKVAQQALKETE
jgi:hypothetical protein